MLTILLIGGAVYGGWRLLAAARASLRDLPRRNEDMFFF